MNTIVGRADAACADAGAAGCREHAPRHSVTAITKIASPTLDICERITTPLAQKYTRRRPENRPADSPRHTLDPARALKQVRQDPSGFRALVSCCRSIPRLAQIRHGPVR